MHKKLLIALLFAVVTVVDVAAHSHKCCVGAYCKMKKKCDAQCSADCHEDHDECDDCDDENEEDDQD